MRGASQLKLAVADARPWRTVFVQVLRDGSVSSLQVTMDQESSNDQLAKLDQTAYEADGGALDGVILGELNSRIRQMLQAPRYIQGAVVLGIEPFSAAAEAGLKAGDVIRSINRQEIKNAAETSHLSRESKHKRMLLGVWSDRGSHFVLIED